MALTINSLYLTEDNFLIHLPQLQTITAGKILTRPKDLCRNDLRWKRFQLSLSPCPEPYQLYKMTLQSLISTIILATFATRAAVLGKRVGLYFLTLLHFIPKGVYHDQLQNLRQHTHAPNLYSQLWNTNAKACERTNSRPRQKQYPGTS